MAVGAFLIYCNSRSLVGSVLSPFGFSFSILGRNNLNPPMPMLMFAFLCVNGSLKANPLSIYGSSHAPDELFSITVIYFLRRGGEGTTLMELVQVTHDAMGPPADS